RLEDIDVVAYPFFDWRKETQLFTKNMQDEQSFLGETPFNDTRQQIDTALARVPTRTQPIPGLVTPNEKREKRLLNKVFYRLAGVEGVLSRNVARRGSQDWSRDAMTYHKAWQDELEENLRKLGLLDKLKRYDHHLSQAANVFCASGYEPPLIAPRDEEGSGLAGPICIGEGKRTRRIHKVEYPHSLGT